MLATVLDTIKHLLSIVGDWLWSAIASINGFVIGGWVVAFIFMLWLWRRIAVEVKADEGVIKDRKGKIVAAALGDVFDHSYDVLLVQQRVAAFKFRRKLCGWGVAILAFVALAAVPLTSVWGEKPEVVNLPDFSFFRSSEPAETGETKSAYVVRLFLPSKVRNARILVDGKPPFVLRRQPDTVYIRILNKPSHSTIQVVEPNGKVLCSTTEMITEDFQNVWPCD